MYLILSSTGSGWHLYPKYIVAWSLRPNGATTFRYSIASSVLVKTRSSNDGLVEPRPLVGEVTCWVRKQSLVASRNRCCGLCNCGYFHWLCICVPCFKFFTVKLHQFAPNGCNLFCWSSYNSYIVTIVGLWKQNLSVMHTHNDLLRGIEETERI